MFSPFQSSTLISLFLPFRTGTIYNLTEVADCRVMVESSVFLRKPIAPQLYARLKTSILIGVIVFQGKEDLATVDTTEDIEVDDLAGSDDDADNEAAEDSESNDLDSDEERTRYICVDLPFDWLLRKAMFNNDFDTLLL